MENLTAYCKSIEWGDKLDFHLKAVDAEQKYQISEEEEDYVCPSSEMTIWVLIILYFWEMVFLKAQNEDKWHAKTFLIPAEHKRKWQIPSEAEETNAEGSTQALFHLVKRRISLG